MHPPDSRFSPHSLCLRQALLLLALLALVFPGVVLRGEVVSPADILFLAAPWDAYAPPGYTHPRNQLMSDVVTFVYPMYALTEAALREGAWPLWNPLELGGMPLLANVQSAVFYPPRLLHRFFDLAHATSLYILLKLFLCGMSAFVCALALGLRAPAARFVSVAWMLGGYVLLWSGWPLSDVSVWAPVLLLGMERAAQGQYRPAFFLVAASGALLLLAGHPETALSFAIGAGVYFVVRLALERPSTAQAARACAVCGAAWLLVLGVCAVQLLPFLEYLRHSGTVEERSGYEDTYGMPFSLLTGFWVPRFFGTNAEANFYGRLNSNIIGQIYAGIAVWVCAALLAARGPRATLESRRAIALLAAGVWGAAAGLRVPGIDLIHRLPLLHQMHQNYHFSGVMLALVLLSGFGLQHWMAQPRSPRELWPVLPVLAAATLMVAAMYLHFGGVIRAMEVEGYVHHQILAAGLFAAMALALLAAGIRRPGRGWIAPALTAVLAADLLYANRGLSPTARPGDVYPDTELTRFLQGLGRPCRISAAEGLIASGTLAPYGIEEWLGYDGLYPERMPRFQRRLGEHIWDVMEPACAKPYILNNPEAGPQFSMEESAHYDLVGVYDGMEVYRSVRAFPRAYVVGGLRLYQDDQDLFMSMLEDEVDPARTVTAVHDPALAEAGLPETAAAPMRPDGARVTRWESTRVEVEAETETPAVLVLADAYFPGWRATLDGAPAAIFPAHEVFRGLLLPPGRHHIIFDYKPVSFRVGLVISTGSLLVGLGLGVRALARERSAKLLL